MPERVSGRVVASKFNNPESISLAGAILKTRISGYERNKIVVFESTTKGICSICLNVFEFYPTCDTCALSS